VDLAKYTYLDDSLSRMMTTLVTGSSGLIGSEAVQYFDRKEYSVIGVDAARVVRRGGRYHVVLVRLKKAAPRFEHRDLDIRDRQGMFALRSSQVVLALSELESNLQPRSNPGRDCGVSGTE
jgi:nucleoside-diphosphate-sugar epimerase